MHLYAKCTIFLIPLTSHFLRLQMEETSFGKNEQKVNNLYDQRYRLLQTSIEMIMLLKVEI